MHCQIIEASDDKGIVVLERLDTKALKQISETNLLSEIAGQRVQILGQNLPTENLLISAEASEEIMVIEKIPAGLASSATVRTFLSKIRWIRALENRGVSDFSNLDYLELEMRHVASRLQNEIQFSPSTIKTAWQKLRNADGDLRALIPHFLSRGGSGQVRTCAIGEGFLCESLAALKADSKAKIFIHQIYDSTKISVAQWNRIHPENLATAPSTQTVNRRVHHTFSSYEIALRNKGKIRAQRLFLETSPKIRAEESLEVAQFDDTDGEVFLVNEINGLPWGRAYITVGIDEYSGEILGFELSEKPRSTWSALSSILHAISPKDMTEEMYSKCESAWKAYGVPAQIVMDNALYNHADQVEAAIASVGSIPSWSKPKTPTGKSQIEHLNHIIKTEFVPTLPGWRGPKGDREGLKDGPLSAVMTVGNYRELFTAWATDEYPMKARETGFTSHQRWDGDFRLCKPLIPSDPAALKLLCTYSEELTFRDSGGLLRMGFRYQSEPLIDLRRRLGSKAKACIRIHPFDLAKMYVFDPFRRLYIIVPCVEHKDYLQGLTHWQQKLILKFCRDTGCRNPNLKELVNAREKLRHLVAQLSTSKKLIERRLVQRIGELPKDKSNIQNPELTVMTEIEANVSALAEVELDFEDPGWAIPMNHLE